MTTQGNLKKLFELFKTDVGEIDETLSPDDRVWDGNEAHYRQVGESAVRCIALALLAAGRDPSGIKTVLDFGCGHGRVLRYLVKVFPEASITASDIDRSAVDFCASTFGATGVYSNVELRGVEFPDSYDLIWCGSVVTHFDAPRWRDLLQLFCSILAPRGVLVLTTGGPTIPQLMAKGWDYFLSKAKLREILDSYRRTGFGYVDYDGKQGLGISIARRSWTIELLRKFPRLGILTYLERGWDNHQDVIACVNGLPELAPGPQPEKTADLDFTDL